MVLYFLPKTVEFINLHEKSYRVNQIVNCGVAVLEIKIMQFGVAIKLRAFDVDKNILAVMRPNVCILPNRGTNAIYGDVIKFQKFFHPIGLPLFVDVIGAAYNALSGNRRAE